MMYDVLRLRIVLSYEAIADGITADALLKRITTVIPAPSMPMESHVAIATES